MITKFIKRTVLILFSVAFFYCSIIWLAVALGMSHWLPNFYSTAGGYGQLLLRLRDVQNTEQADLLFVGSSHAYRGFDPREFSQNGIRAFNLGSTSQTPFNTYFLLQEYVPALQPKIVVLELYWNMLVQDGLESTIDIVSNAEHKGGFIEMATRTKKSQAFNSLLANSILRLHTPLHQLEQKSLTSDVYVPGGYTQSQLTKNKLTQEELDKLEPMVVDLSAVQENYLHKIIDFCRQRDIKLVFVVTPVTPAFKEKVLNYEAYTLFLSNLATQHGIPFFDYNTRPELKLHPQLDFYDQDHLTHRGVQKFNQAFIQDLQARGIVTQGAATGRLVSNY